jgi:hypothetical protein
VAVHTGKALVKYRAGRAATGIEPTVALKVRARGW